MFKARIFIISLLSFSASAQDAGPLTFQTWKEQQVLEAQNQVLRAAARVTAAKRGKPQNVASKDDGLPLHNAKIRKAMYDSIPATERDLRLAQESLQGTSNLNLEDYVGVYLPTLQDQPEALNALAQRLSKEELAEIFKALVRKDPPADAKRNSTPSGPLAVTARPRIP